MIHSSESELMLWPFEVFPYIYMRKPYIRNVFCPHAVVNGEYPSRTRTYYIDDLYPIGSIVSMLAQLTKTKTK